MSAGFILDGVVAALLAATITYCFILYRRLNVLREASAEMRQVLAGFNAATARAQSGVAVLKQLSGDSAGALQDRIEKARSLSDELQFMTEAAAHAAERLEAGLDARRAQAGEDAATEGGTVVPLATAPGGAGAGLGADEEITVESEADRELLSTLRRTR